MLNEDVDLVRQILAEHEAMKQARRSFEQQRAQQGEADIAKLKQEWGAQYDANTELGRRVVRVFGGDGETLERISQSLGDAETMRLFQRIGSRLGEGTLAAQDGGAASKQNSEKTLAGLMFSSTEKPS